MRYSRNPTGNMRRRDHIWGYNKCRRYLHWRWLPRPLRVVLWWSVNLLAYVVLVLITLALILGVLYMCAWAGGRAEAQAPVRNLSLDEGFLMGYRHGWQDSMLLSAERRRLSRCARPVGWMPPGEPSGERLAALDLELANNPL